MTKPLTFDEKLSIISTLYPQSDKDFYDKGIESPLPFERKTTTESFLLRIASFKEAYQLIVGNEIFQQTEAEIEKKLKDTSDYIRREYRIEKQLGAVLYFRNYLVELLSEKLKIKIGETDKQLTEADLIYNWKKRKILYSAYKRENTEYTVALIDEVASQPLPQSGEFQEETDEGEQITHRFINTLQYEWERDRIKEMLQNSNEQKTLPCNLRTLPGIPNFEIHKLHLYDIEKNLMGEGINLRSATFCPSQTLGRELQKAYILYNLKKFIEFIDTSELYKRSNPQEPYLIISFLNNVPFTDERQLNKLMLEVIDEENKKRQREGSPKILYADRSVNHTFWRLFSLPGFYPNTYTRREKKISSLILEEIGIKILDNKTAQLLTSWLNEYKKFFLFRHHYNDKFNAFYTSISARLAYLKDRLKTYIKELEELQNQPNPSKNKIAEKKEAILRKKEKILKITAIQDYVELLHKDPFRIRDKNPNLYRSALEQIIAKKSIVGCRQGKDRTGIYMTHYDSMLECFYTNPELTLPRYFDEGLSRENFSTAFCDNFQTNQQAYISGLNSQGCRGLKYMNQTMASDQVKKIKKTNPTLFEDNQIIADMNKINYNKRKEVTPPTSLASGKKQTAELTTNTTHETKQDISPEKRRGLIAQRNRDDLNPFLQRKKIPATAPTKTEAPSTAETKTPPPKQGP